VDNNNEAQAEQLQHIRLAVRQLCAKYGEDYWLDMDRTLGYPSDFVQELTDAYIGAMEQAGDLNAFITETLGIQAFANTEGIHH